GLERIAEISEAMREIQARRGFGDDKRAFIAHLEQDVRWRAADAQGVEKVFQNYIERLKPRMGEFFAQQPKAPYEVAPLPRSAEGSTTFGFYDSPTKERGRGVYFFNSGNLVRQALFNVAALTYHELMPGHHMHLSMQQENTGLHPIRSNSFVNAY